MGSVAEALANAVEHHRAGRLQAAEDIYRQIIAADPKQVDALHLLGVVYSQSGDQARAVEYIQRAIELKGGDATFHSNLGSAHKAQGKLEQAASAYRRALELNPRSAAIHSNLGSVHEAAGQLDEAVGCFRRALALEPNYALAHYNLGSVFQTQQMLDAAIACFRRAMELNPEHAEAFSNLGNALHDQGNLEEAAAACQRAVELKPGLVEAHNNLGNIWQALGKHEEAVECYRRAIGLKADYAEAHSNLANALKHVRRFEDALASYARAVEIDGDYAAAHCGRSMLRLMLGDFERGWREYEWRWKTRQALVRNFSQPRWDGSPLGERTILLYDEQGFGDTIQFVRYAPLIKQQNPAARIVVECQGPLKRLLGGCLGIDQLVARGEELPTFDVCAPLLSLPAIMGTSLKTVPAGGPYLAAEPALVAEWKERLARIPGVKVGINWHGRPGTGDHSRRNIPLACFAALAEIPGVTLISLQKGDEEFKVQCSKFKVGDGLGGAIVDLGEFDTAHGAFTDTAAIMMNLDLVISSDTAVPHLAGALGARVWLALPLIADWRWMLERGDSPWYPTMRVFRQRVRGDWREVFDEIGAELVKLVQSGARQTQNPHPGPLP